MSPKVEQITPSVALGEGPHWDVASQALYFVDIVGQKIHKYVPETKRHTTAYIESGTVSFIIPIEGQENKFLISIGRKLASIEWNGEDDRVSKIEILGEVDTEPENKDNQINDGKCDPSGRLWAGTMGALPEEFDTNLCNGNMFSMEKGKITRHVSKIGISNGLVFTEDGKTMYYIDSFKGVVQQFDLNIKEGIISNSKNVFTLSKHNIKGLLDGMAIDSDGNLWIAIFGASKVIKIDPRKPETLLETLTIPAKQTTSVTFGGPNLDEMYVTSGSIAVRDYECVGPENGATYRVTGLGVKGCPAVNMKI